MVRSPRSLLCLLLCLAAFSSLGVLWTGASAPPLPANQTTTRALNHWVLEPKNEDGAVVGYARDFVEYAKREHPDATLQIYEVTGVLEQRRLHVLLETVDTTAQEAFLRALETQPEGRRIVSQERQFCTVTKDTYMRLISSDPEKEQRMGNQGGAMHWNAKARFPAFGRAVECAERLTQHLNAAYPNIYVRAYDEWSPRTGTIHFYFHGTGRSTWVEFEGAMRRDPIANQILSEAEELFVVGSFEDRAMSVLAR